MTKYLFFRVVLFQNHFGSGAGWIRNNFFRIRYRIRILLKVSKQTASGSGATTLAFFNGLLSKVLLSKEINLVNSVLISIADVNIYGPMDIEVFLRFPEDIFVPSTF
jgi:hypothetical protein